LRILLSNDDGIHAPGLAALERIAATLSEDVWVVAPEQEQSASAHSLSVHLPVRVRKISAKRYAVSGTPTDCALLAVKEILPNAKGQISNGKNKKAPVDICPLTFDLILSGINNGSNVGDDVTYSGTIAAAMEGTLLGVPSIAFSQLTDDRGDVLWQIAEKHAPDLIKKLIKTGWPKGTLINVNFPHCPPGKVKGIKLCPQGKRRISVALTERADPKGRPYFWIGGERDNTPEQPNVDIAFLHAGYITVTPIGMDLTDYKTLEKLRTDF